MSTTKKKTATKTVAAKPRSKKTVAVEPVEQPEVRLLFGSDKTKAVKTSISHARRAIHEVLQNGPVTVDQLAAKLNAKYSISRSAIDRQLKWELNIAKRPRIKRDSKGRLSLLEGYVLPSFRHAE